MIVDPNQARLFVTTGNSHYIKALMAHNYSPSARNWLHIRQLRR